MLRLPSYGDGNDTHHDMTVDFTLADFWNWDIVPDWKFAETQAWHYAPWYRHIWERTPERGAELTCEDWRWAKDTIDELLAERASLF